jgi:ADP-ribose pyrophosphatase YjhB (NUDIX family)
MKFCSRCGHSLSQKLIEGRTRRVCESCGHVFYKQLKVGAGVVVERDGDVLLMRRGAGVFAFPCTWCLPAGYCEHNEAPKQTAAREANEETGLEVAIGDIFGVFFFDDDPRGNGILIIYRATVIGGDAACDGQEVEALCWFAPDELPEALAGGGHDRAIQAWKRSFLRQ